MVKQKLRDQKAKLTFWTLKNTIVRKDEKDSRNDKKEEFCYIHVHAGYNHKLPMRSLKFFKVFLQLFAEQKSKVLFLHIVGKLLKMSHLNILIFHQFLSY